MKMGIIITFLITFTGQLHGYITTFLLEFLESEEDF